MYAIDLELIVQMWACGQARSAYIADDLALLNMAACTDAFSKAVHVRVQRPVTLTVLNDHGITVSAVATSERYATVARRLDRCTTWCCVIHPFVGADLVEHRVATASGKARADARNPPVCG